MSFFEHKISYIDYRKKYPENHYEEISTRLKELRKLCNVNGDDSLLPIPGEQLYEQIIKRHENKDEKFKKELEVIIIEVKLICITNHI